MASNAAKRGLALAAVMKRSNTAVTSRPSKVSKPDICKLDITVACYVLEDNSVLKEYVRLRQATFMVSLSADSTINKHDLETKLTQAIEDLRPELAGTQSVFLLKETGIGKRYQAAPGGARDGKWLLKEYSTARVARMAVHGEVSLKVHLGILQSQPQPQPQPEEVIHQVQSTTEQPQLATVMEGEEHEDEDEDGLTPREPQAPSQPHHATDRPLPKPDTVTHLKQTQHPGATLKELHRTLEVSPCPSRFCMSNPLEVALQMISFLPGVMSKLSTADMTVMSLEESNIAEALLTVFSFTTTQRSHQRLALANLLLTTGYLDGSVSVNSLFDSILKRVGDVESDVKLNVWTTLAGTLREEDDRDHGFWIKDKKVRIEDDVTHLLKNKKGEKWHYTVDTLPKVLCFHMTEAESVTFSRKVKVTGKPETGEESFFKEEQGYTLAAIATDSFVCKLPLKADDDMILYNEDRKATFSKEKVQKAFKPLMKILAKECPARIMLYALDTLDCMPEEGVPSDTAEGIVSRVTTQYPHVSYTEEDLAGSVISERFKALSMMDKVEEVIDMVMERHHLKIGRDMKEAILQYIIPCLREKCFLANHQYKQEPHRHLVFAGPAGTGKTSVAKAFAEILYELGLSESKDVVVIRRDTISSEYVNKMERRMTDAMKKAAGNVILVDEIYQLGSGREAIKALEAIMNRALEPKTSSSIIILAGYLRQIEAKIFSLNEGFRGRFPDTVRFLPLTAQQLTDILEHKIKLSGYSIANYNRQDMEKAIGDIPIEVRGRHNARLVNQLIVRANSGQEETRSRTLFERLNIPFKNLVSSCKDMRDKQAEKAGLGDLGKCPTCGHSLMGDGPEEQEEGYFDYNDEQSGSSQQPDKQPRKSGKTGMTLRKDK